ncbi:Uncharacterised protein [Bordetella hinzii]|nr:hypothetical protein AXA74_20425 [Bordetella hinzii LMG 13501]VEH23180.1 Uncharacterised protein [Bordetella hinzii]
MTACENMASLGHGFYIVRTQAGFRKAVKRFIAQRGHADLCMRDVCGFPKSYPALVSFDVCYRGYDYVSANCLPLWKLGAVLDGPGPPEGACAVSEIRQASR